MHDFTNKEIAKILNEYSDLMKINGENKYKIRAYNNASRMIGSLSTDLSQLVEEDRLEDIQGIGKGIASTIKEIYTVGYYPPLAELKNELPSGVLELINIPGLGPARAHHLFYKLGIKDIDDLREALVNKKVRTLKGFGPKTEEKLLKALDDYEQYRGVIFIGEAIVQSEMIIQYFEERTDIINKIAVTGSTRRQKEVIGDIDILLASDKNAQVREFIIDLPFIKNIVEKGDTKISVITEKGLQIDFRIISNREFPTALQYFTGSKEHNVKLRQLARQEGFKLNEYGLFKDGKQIEVQSESEIYNSLNLEYIIPELREDRGEIEAAEAGELPDSIELSDIKGDLHLHSRYSDGAYSIEDMVKVAREIGYQYLAITDHSQSLRVAHGMSPEDVEHQIKEIDSLQQKYDDIKILKGIEVDILTDGSLDYPDQILEGFDLVIASIHVGFNQDKKIITDRIVRAMQNPYIHIIAHPQGRILGKRKSYEVDMDRVIQVASETGTCLEINASPYRLDLDDIMVKYAVEAGVKVAINTDSHHIDELGDMILGIGVARRGWLEKEDVINTMDTKHLYKFLRGG